MAIAPILSGKLNRRYPLWELWYLDGIINDRVGLVMKFHHCLLDGAVGSVVAALLLDLEPTPPPRPTPATRSRSRHRATCGYSSAASRRSRPRRCARSATPHGSSCRGVDLGRYAVLPRPKPDLAAMLQAPRTSFNAPISPWRAVAFSSVALADVKALRRHFDAKVNDIVLALCSGVLR